MTPLARILALPVRTYRLVLSPWIGNGCRFQPTCSAYALEALSLHGGIKGGLLAAHRICRCHPWGGAGYDPVPGADPTHDAACRAALPLSQDDPPGPLAQKQDRENATQLRGER